jgi:hypothetical protein
MSSTDAVVSGLMASLRSASASSTGALSSAGTLSPLSARNFSV